MPDETRDSLRERALEIIDTVVDHVVMAADGRVRAKISAVDAVAALLTQGERATQPCGVCCGKPLASGRECICGGVGTEAGEMEGLRRELMSWEQAAGNYPALDPEASDKYAHFRAEEGERELVWLRHLERCPRCRDKRWCADGTRLLEAAQSTAPSPEPRAISQENKDGVDNLRCSDSDLAGSDGCSDSSGTLAGLAPAVPEGERLREPSVDRCPGCGRMFVCRPDCPATGTATPRAVEDEGLEERYMRAMAGDPLAKRLAEQVVQSIADSEPRDLSIIGMEALQGTEAESLFVLEGDTIEKAVHVALSNAFFDGLLASPRPESEPDTKGAEG